MSTSEQTRQLAGGVVMAVRDESAPYAYGNIFHVRLQVTVRFPGNQTPYRKELERMAVHESDVAAVRDELLRGFEEQVLPYLQRPDFAERFQRHQLEKLRRSREGVSGYS